MRKRREEKALREEEAQSDLKPQLENAREFPLKECWITADWADGGLGGLVNVVVSRERPDKKIIAASFLLDVYCLGLKDGLYKVGLSKSKSAKLVDKVFSHTEAEKCSPELAHQMVYECIDYAAQFGFEPHKDFEIAQYVLQPRGTLDTPHDITFGKDGKPFYVNGPYDDVDAILAKLNKNPGKGNYTFLSVM